MATIIGTPESENLIGTVNDDTITGLGGDDVLTGGDGGDRFIYERLSDLSVWTGAVTDSHETITDFGEHGSVIEPDENDVLDFSAFAGFTFVGDDAFTATGRSEYRFQHFGSEGILIQFDQAGDGTADHYLVLDRYRGASDVGDPVGTNLLHLSDFYYHYEVGTVADDKLVGTNNNDGTFGDRIYGLGGDDRLYGKAGSDELFGGDGDDRLDGGDGADTMAGGSGDDVYFVESEHESVIEAAGGGSDLVNSSGFYFFLPSNVESLTLTGTAFQGSGNSLNNEITGNSVTNVLAGNAGNDSISGAGGADSIRGGAGKDWIRGGDGGDLLTGGGEFDKFAYYSVDEIGGAGAGPQDVITDFAGIGSDAAATDRDRIDLHRIDADVTTEADDAFHFIGDEEFTGAAGELRATAGTTLVTDPDPIYGEDPYEAEAILVEGDSDGDGAADFQLAVLGTTPLQAGDFSV
ncbi:MAG: hypothetical protein GEU95_10705 [Rhizobiales bacterium]|nr:hypothetical protein [Hyphomicrobiales bacterium]